MKWFICCGNSSQNAPSTEGKVSIVNLDNIPNRTVVPVKDSPSNKVHLPATSNHPTHSGTKNNNTDLQEPTNHLSNKASIVS